jgi:hypothetical protein
MSEELYTYSNIIISVSVSTKRGDEMSLQCTHTDTDDYVRVGI